MIPNVFFAASFLDLNDVVVAEENMPTTLGCTDTTAKGDISISWMVKSLSTDEWKLLLTATERNNFSGASSRASMQLLDRNFKDSGVFSLYLVPTVEDSGLYTCLIKQKGRKLKERIHLLAILRGNFSVFDKLLKMCKNI